jgi:hypothetical protein
MRKEKTLFILAIWIMVLPFLGFPESWEKVFFIITGLAFIYLAYLFYLESKNRLLKHSEESKTFVDNIENNE